MSIYTGELVRTRTKARANATVIVATTNILYPESVEFDYIDSYQHIRWFLVSELTTITTLQYLNIKDLV